MLGLCLYVPVSNSDPVEVEYFESNGLPSELKSLFNKLSVFLPSQEFSTYQRWRKVSGRNTCLLIALYLCQQLQPPACLNLLTLTITKSFLSGHRKALTWGSERPYD